MRALFNRFTLQTRLDGVPNVKPQKRKYMLQKIFLALLVLFLLGCTTKEQIIEIEIEKEVERQYQWQRQAGIDFDSEVLTNSYATEDYFFAMGYTKFISTVKDSLWHPHIDNQSNFTIFRNLRLVSNTKFPMAAYYYVYNNPSGSEVAIAPNFRGATKFLRMLEVDPAFSGFYSSVIPFSLHIVSNNANQLLIPYRHSISATPRLLLVEVVRNVHDGTTIMDTGQISIIELPKEMAGVNPDHLTAIKNHFYFSYGDTYRVDTNGDLSMILEGVALTYFIPVGNTIYGMSAENKLYQSTDEGKTWREIGDNIRFPGTSHLHYTTIAGKTVAYNGVGKIYDVSFLPGEVTYRELENDGIQHTRITSVTEFQGKVYVTTLAGLYTREVQHFFEGKGGS